MWRTPVQSDYLSAWPGNVLGRRSRPLRGRVQVEGWYRRQGGADRYAGIEVVAEPAAAFAVAFDLDPELLARLEGDTYGRHFLDEAVFGMLDVLITAEPLPVLGVSIRVVRLDVHPVDSHIEDFRLAGQAAARQIIEAARG